MQILVTHLQKHDNANDCNTVNYGRSISLERTPKSSDRVGIEKTQISMKKQIKLSSLEVKSFVTSSTLMDMQTIKGGKNPPRSYKGDCVISDPGGSDDGSDLSIDFCSGQAPYACGTGGTECL